MISLYLWVMGSGRTKDKGWDVLITMGFRDTRGHRNRDQTLVFFHDHNQRKHPGRGDDENDSQNTLAETLAG